MKEDIVYGLLEMSYAKLNGLDPKSKYFNDLKKFLPQGWYLINKEKRINILKEALEKKINVKETTAYKNRYPEGALTSNK